ncbi:opsin-3 [Rana temporaria]|uniref:opsin-3 n=1 Tax=Rana temporaria TaxID=8407 RepID=UPI001AAC831D|nr:opsin-3 [Rana temporaria]
MFHVIRNASKVDSQADNEKLFSQDTYDFLALLVASIGVLGLCTNSLVLILYCRFKTLRTPTNLLLVNLSFSDFVFSLFGVSFIFASCVSRQWIWDEEGCIFVGLCENLLGCVSVFTLTVVAYERYVRVVFDKIVDFPWSWKAITSIWLCSMVWSTAPLMEWNRYILEPHGLDCSLDRVSTETSQSSFILLSFLACFVAPVSVMIYCYGYILYSVRMLRKLQSVETSQVLRLFHYEVKVAIMCLLMISAFLLCWMPYTVLSFLAMSGHGDMITPGTAIVPCFLVKTGAATNAIIYILTSKKFRQGLTKLLWMKCLKNHIIFARRRKLVGVDVGKKLKKIVRYTSSSFSSVITTGQTDTQQSVEETQDNYVPNVKIIHVQPL